MDGNFHVLISVEGGTKVKILDICTHIICSVCADCVVDINFVVVKYAVCVLLILPYI